MVFKKCFVYVLIVFFVFLCSYSINAFSVEKITIYLRIGSSNARVNDQWYLLDLAPFLYQQRTMVPLRFISESLKATVEWLPNPDVSGEGIIIINLPSPGKRIKLHTRVPVVFIEEINHDQEISVTSFMIDAEPFIVKPQNRTVVPLRFIAEAFGAQVTWNAEDQSVNVLYYP